MRRVRRTATWLLVLAALALAGLLLYGHSRRHPEDVPWTELDLTRPVGAFTGRKLADLADDGPRCKHLLERAGVRFATLAPRRASEQCGYDHAVRPERGRALAIGYRPAFGANCAVVAGLALWEWHVVQPAAQRHFGQPVRSIDQLGSYSCRRLYGREQGGWSEHATANAVDIAGFNLADGRRISVLGDWDDDGPSGRFLAEVRDGACRLFATVLSPEYNAAHRDHLHLDQAERGGWGWRACR